MDEIRIDRLKIFANHGVYDFEKREGQNFYVTAVMKADLKRVGATDNLDDTVNYAEAAELIREVFTEASCDTIEAAAEAVIEALLSKYHMVKSVTVKVSKPDAPVELEIKDLSVTLTRSRHTVYLGLGSNLGDRQGYLDKAIEELGKDSAITVKKVSEFIETEPYGPVEQPDYLNGVAEIETILDPDELLSVVHDIEQEAGRERVIHWGPRTLDLDILFYDDRIINTEHLTIPHPEIQKREFVLKPLAEIAPFMYHPVLNKNVMNLYEDLKNSGYASVDHIEAEDFREVEEIEKTGKTVCYAGVPGAYAEEAAIKYFGGYVDYMHVKRFDDVVKAVADGKSDYGIIPIENSSAGFVSGNYDIIREGGVKIIAQVTIDINHCLVGLKEATLADIIKVYSHPQGLMQCKDYIDENGLQTESVSNTARAAQRVRDDGDKSHAAISSERAAEIYDLQVLDKNINFSNQNATKFVILTKGSIFASDSVNVSICFKTLHRVGALYDVIGIINSNQINMTSIESRPSLIRQWEYWFYVTFEGKLTDRNVVKALKELKANTEDMAVLGTF